MLHIFFIFLSFSFLCGVDARWRPELKTSWNIQYSGKLPDPKTFEQKVINLDLFDTPINDIQKYKQNNIKVICYFSAGSAENWRPDFSNFPKSSIGKPLDGWNGEFWLDISNAAVRKIMLKRITLAAEKKCDAVDPDNVDGYTQNTGFKLTFEEQLQFNLFLSQTAHSYNLAVGLKNDLDQVKELVSFFDFAVNEQCAQYKECSLLQPFVEKNKPVFQIEYGNLSASKKKKLCEQTKSTSYSLIFKKLNLGQYTDFC